jgi:two-component system sensor histidine kinase TctE
MWHGLKLAGRGSLTVRLLSVIILPLCGLALLLGIGGALVISTAVQTVNDRILAATSRAIADSLAIEDGEISLDLPPATFGMLEDIERDNVYYNVRYGDHVLTGYSDLPDIVPKGMADLQVEFGDSVYHRKDIRVIAEGRRLPGLSQPVVVEVAETMDARRISERQLLHYLALLELTLVALTVLILPVAVRWGMRPLDRVRADMDRRAASDLHALPEQQVPSEIRPVVRGFNDLLGRFAGLLEDTRRFTADASHQMRTPLSILRAHIALLRGAPAGSKQASDSLNDLDEASERLQHLIVQLLALARADNAARAELQLQEVNLNLLVEEVCADHAPAAVAAGIELEFDPVTGDAIAMSDPVLAREMIANLVDNAIRYGAGGAAIHVSLADAGAELLVAIEDNGPGIAPELREAVFSRFTRLNPAANRSGSGLGLPIAQSLANAIRARMVLGTPATGTGLRAEIYFPRASTES